MRIYFYQEAPSYIEEELVLELNKHTEVQLVEASPELKEALISWDQESDLNCVVMSAVDYEECRVLIACDNESKFYSWCINQCSHAEWGCSNSYISVDYSSGNQRLYNQLHECLHFLDVDDCYQEDDPKKAAKVTCNNENCVMRYGSLSTEICSTVLNQIEKWANNSSKKDALTRASS